MMTKGPFTHNRYTAVWVPQPREVIDNEWVFAGEDGEPGFWTYKDQNRLGPSVGYADQRHPTPDAALKAAVDHDVVLAAQADHSDLTREDYEAEVKRLKLRKTWDDKDAYAMRDGRWDIPTYGIKGAAERTLASRRGRAIERGMRREREAIGSFIALMDRRYPDMDATEQEIAAVLNEVNDSSGGYLTYEKAIEIIREEKAQRKEFEISRLTDKMYRLEDDDRLAEAARVRNQIEQLRKIGSVGMAIEARVATRFIAKEQFSKA